jgi:hypothetical protein
MVAKVIGRMTVGSGEARLEQMKGIPSVVREGSRRYVGFIGAMD